ncbi:Uma2 family endonuclease [Nostoc sp. TCL240-02]|uniref:Uma2 family endonuclease n=1 Tax=Nostoc sp. TCL240-02 TaxID=2572090 RepID=UPI00157FAE9D|nr:Uma2 family endonuclease [Nostoc sp. TCL240-02]QKQ76663.1 Uma2 family endonuclease [Nostoc sp. TCL240-02]
MVQTPAKPLTLSEFLDLPETEPASEYIDGRIIQKPMPQGEHSAIQTELAPAINLIVKPKQIARAFCELRCTFGVGVARRGHRSIVPDISVFMFDRIPRKDNGGVANVFSIAPNWTIEILSPDQSQTKVTKNILHCLKYGTQMGWLIDPKEQSVFVYLPDQPTTFYEELGTQLPVPEFAKDFSLTVAGLFS